MPFTWTQNIAVGALIESADLQEIRTNVDYVEDNKCANHDTTVEVGDDSGYDGTYRGTVQSGDDSGYDGTYDGTALDLQDTGHHDGYDSGVKTDYRISV